MNLEKVLIIEGMVNENGYEDRGLSGTNIISHPTFAQHSVILQNMASIDSSNNFRDIKQLVERRAGIEFKPALFNLIQLAMSKEFWSD